MLSVIMLSVMLDKNSFLIVMLSVILDKNSFLIIMLSVILDKNPFLVVMLSDVAPLQLQQYYLMERKTNGREPKSCFVRAFNFKVGGESLC
jgi:hypothetical protein